MLARAGDAPHTSTVITGAALQRPNDQHQGSGIDDQQQGYRVEDPGRSFA